MGSEIHPDQLAARLERVADKIGQPSDSRVREAARLMPDASARVASAGQLALPVEVQRFALAMQDGTLFADAGEALLASPEVAGARRRLRASAAGSLLVPDPPEQDQGRDALWELFLAALLRRGGFEPALVEPDVVVVAEGVRLGVAAKRVRSGKRLEDRVAKAVEQISRGVAGHRLDCGLVALDVSFMLEQHAQHGVWSLSQATAKPQVRGVVGSSLRRVLDTAAAVVVRTAGGEHVVGVTAIVTPVLRYADARQLGLVRYFFTMALQLLGHSPAHLHALGTVAARCFADGG